MKRTAWFLVLVVFSSILVSGAQAQVIQEHLRRIEAQTPKDPLFSQWTTKEEVEETFQFGGWSSHSMLFLDNADNDAATADGVNHIYIQDTRLWGKYEMDDGSSIYARVKNVGFNFDLSPGTARPVLSNERLDLDLAYLDKQIADDTTLRVGRQYIRQGRGLTLNGNFDGVLAEKNIGRWDFNAYLVRSTPNEPDLDPLITHPRRFYNGVNVGFLNEEGERYFAYYLGEHDNSPQPGAIPAALQRFDYDADYFAMGTSGDFTQNLSYYGESIVQRGSHLAAGSSLRVENQASADYAEMVYHPAWDGHPTFSAEYARASGSPNRAPGINTAAGNALGADTRSFLGFGRYDFGIALNPRLSNIVIERFGATWKPWEKQRYLDTLTIGGKFSIYQKDDAAGGISNLQATAINEDVGNGIDLFLGWRPLSDLSIIAQWGKFSPGDAFPAATHDDAESTFVSATYSF